MMIEGARTEELKRALEALRNGVPSRDAVRFLGCGQDSVVGRFREQLDLVEPRLTEDRQAEGLLVQGGFGSGKSHLLEYLEHIALEQSFVCSRVVISKETPLYEPTKVYQAAVETAVLPSGSGPAIPELALSLNQNSPAYADFYLWANSPESNIAAIFPATLLLRERLSGDPELVEEISGFWAGEKLSVARVRQGLRQIGESTAFSVRAVPAKQLALQRFRFAARLMRAASCRGWVILIDEVELVGRYSLLQRAKSYAELARWLGSVDSDQYPGITTVAAISDAFALAVLHEKHDRDDVGPRLRDRGTEEFISIAAQAETGMRLIDREAVPLIPPTRDTLDGTYALLKSLHGTAYGWTPPDVPSAGLAKMRAMRAHVRRWINEWDLRRLYPTAELRTEEEELTYGYSEDRDLEVPPDEDATHDGAFS